MASVGEKKRMHRKGTPFVFDARWPVARRREDARLTTGAARSAPERSVHPPPPDSLGGAQLERARAFLSVLSTCTALAGNFTLVIIPPLLITIGVIEWCHWVPFSLQRPVLC